MENLKNYIIGAIIFTFFIVGGVAMLSEFNASDPTFTDDSGKHFYDFNKSFSKLDDINESTSSMQKSISDFDQDPGLWGMINALVTSAWSGLRSVFTSFSFMNDSFRAISNVFGIPTWVGGLIISIITIIIIFAIYKAIFKVT